MQPLAPRSVSISNHTLRATNKLMIYEDSAKCYKNYECPKCHQRGNFKNHGSYTRNLITKFENTIIEITRIKCCSCDSTHAIIPKEVIPYKSLSLNTVLEIAWDYLCGYSNSQIRKKYNLTESTRRRYIKAIKEDLSLLFGVNNGHNKLKTRFLKPQKFKNEIKEHCATKLLRKFCEHVRLNNPLYEVKAYSDDFP